MLTREEATQSKLASEIRNDGQSGENRSSTFLNYHSNDESADVMPTLEPHYPPEIKSHQMTCVTLIYFHVCPLELNSFTSGFISAE